MKKLISFLLLFVVSISAFSCPVCERNKPKFLRGITHGSNPDSNWDYAIVATIAIIALLTLFYSVKWLLNPKETNKDHIKYSFLNKK